MALFTYIVLSYSASLTKTKGEEKLVQNGILLFQGSHLIMLVVVINGFT